MAGDMGNEFPADIWAKAMADAAGLRNAVVWQSNAANEIIALHLARAVMAERERAVEVCEAQKASFASDEYATPQPLGGLMERFACDRCIEAIRNPAQSKPEGEAA